MSRDVGSDALVSRLRVASSRCHRMCLAVLGVDTPQERHVVALRASQMIETVWQAKAPPSLLVCSRNGQPSDTEGLRCVVWAFGQTQKHDCLGRTFDGLVIFDVRDMAPETLWAAAGTVRGGGLVTVVVQEASVQAAASVQGRYRLLPRMVLSLWEADSRCFVDSSFLPLAEVDCLAGTVEKTHTGPRERQLEEDQHMEKITNCTKQATEFRAVLRLCCTNEQRSTLTSSLLELATGKVMISGRRGGGKSAIGGLCLACVTLDGRLCQIC